MTRDPREADPLYIGNSTTLGPEWSRESALGPTPWDQAGYVESLPAGQDLDEGYDAGYADGFRSGLHVGRVAGKAQSKVALLLAFGAGLLAGVVVGRQ